MALRFILGVSKSSASLVKVTEIYPNIVRAALIARGLLPLDQSTDWAPLEEDEVFSERYHNGID